jgi:RNA 3'-terminal phosphate cyclase (ATP)
VPHAPPAEYLAAVYLPALRRAGLEVHFRYPRAGFFPKGGGEVEIEIRAAAPTQPLDFTERGKLRTLTAYIVTAELPEHVAERGVAAVTEALRRVGRKATIERRDRPSHGPGAAVVLVAECDGGLAGFTALGQRGKPMEQVSEEACAAFMAWWKTGAPCDEHLADQLVLPMALAAGESRWTTPAVTQHLRTVLWVTQQFLPIGVSLDEAPDGSGTLTLRGAGER